MSFQEREKKIKTNKRDYTNLKSSAQQKKLLTKGNDNLLKRR